MKKGWWVTFVDGRPWLERAEYYSYYSGMTPRQVVKEWRSRQLSSAEYHADAAERYRKLARAKVHGMPKKKGKR